MEVDQWRPDLGLRVRQPAHPRDRRRGRGALDPKIVYVGTGNNTLGAGVFRSDDAGTTWKATGLGDTIITALLVDPTNPDVVIAAARSAATQLDGLLQQRSDRRARRVSHHRWRQNVGAHPVRGQLDERGRAGNGSGDSGDCLCEPVERPL